MLGLILDLLNQKPQGGYQDLPVIFCMLRLHRGAKEMDGGREGEGKGGGGYKTGNCPQILKEDMQQSWLCPGTLPTQQAPPGMTFSHPGQAGGGGASWLPNVNITECCMLPAVSQHPSLAIVNSLLLNSS